MTLELTTKKRDVEKVTFSAERLKLRDPENICKQVEAFIREKIKELDKDGIILGLSGGLDSTVVAYLCARTVGSENVLALYMPDKDSNPKHGEDAEKIARLLGIRFRVVPLTPLLQAFGVYKIYPMNFLNLIPSKRLKGWIMVRGKDFIEKITRRNLFIESHQGSRNSFIAGGSAYAHIKRRLHMVILHYQAELENLLVVGAANRTEYLTGVFVKFGADAIADIMPILPLFKTQVRQLARHLGIPKDITEKPADPDLFPGFSDKAKLFGPEETLDLILYGLEEQFSPTEIAAILGINLKDVKEKQVLVKTSRHMRESPYVPELSS